MCLFFSIFIPIMLIFSNSAILVEYKKSYPNLPKYVKYLMFIPPITIIICIIHFLIFLVSYIIDTILKAIK